MSDDNKQETPYTSESQRKREALIEVFTRRGLPETQIETAVGKYLDSTALAETGEPFIFAEGLGYRPADEALDALADPNRVIPTQRDKMIAFYNSQQQPSTTSAPPAVPKAASQRETREEQTARVLAQHAADKLAAKNPEASSLDLSKPWDEISTAEYQARRKAGLFPDR